MNSQGQNNEIKQEAQNNNGESWQVQSQQMGYNFFENQQQYEIPIQITSTIRSKQYQAFFREIQQIKMTKFEQYVHYVKIFYGYNKILEENEEENNSLNNFTNNNKESQNNKKLEIYQEFEFSLKNKGVQHFYDCIEDYEWKVMSNKQKLAQLRIQQQKQDSENFVNKSKYHNKNKVIFCGILRGLDRENIENLPNLPEKYKRLINSIVEKCRQSGVKRKNVENEKSKIEKADGFNHAHYRLMFMPIREFNYNQIKNMEQDIQLHKDIFELDFRKYDQFIMINPLKIKEINFVKFSFGVLFERYIMKVLVQNACQMGDSFYEDKACKGIDTLRQGYLITRF